MPKGRYSFAPPLLQSHAVGLDGSIRLAGKPIKFSFFSFSYN